MSAARRVVLAASGAGWEAAAVRALESAADVVLVRRCVDVAELIAVAQAGGIDVAAVDPTVPGLDVDAVRAVTDAGVRVVALGRSERAGALGIDTAADGTDVVGAVRAAGPVTPAAGQPLSATSTRRARVITVWGPAGAPGRSTLALALADAAANAGHDAVLVDADTYGGAQAQLLGLLDEVSGLMAACRAANHGQLGDLSSHLHVVRPGLSVLTGIPRPDMWVHVRRAPLERVVERLHDGPDVVVHDVGFSLEPGEGTMGAGRNQATELLLEEADDVIVVGRADPVGLTRLVRGLHDLAERGVTAPRVVLNQVRPGIGWSPAELVATLERLAGTRPVALIPRDADVLDAAAVRGSTPLEVASSSPFVDAVARLTSTVLATARAG